MQRENKWQDRFDEQFGYSPYDEKNEEYTDSIGRDAGCDDCYKNREIRAEHKRFVQSEIDRAVAEERERIVEIIKEEQNNYLDLESEETFNVLEKIINIITKEQ